MQLNAARASDVSLAWAIVVVLAGVLLLPAGVVIIRDWHGWGTRYYQFTTRLPLPGNGFYRKRGYGTYRVLVGGSYVVVGFAFLVVASLALMRS